MAAVKQANRLVGITTRKEHTSQLQSLHGGRAAFSALSFFSGVSSRGFSLWAMWVLGRTFLRVGSW